MTRGSDKKQSAMWMIGWLLYAVILFLPVLRSGYMYDDLYNYAAKGYALTNGISIWEMTKHFAMHWFNDVGRPFLFGWYTYALFSVIGLKTYKALIVAMTCVNGLLFSRFVFRICENKAISLSLLFFFPILFCLDCSYFNAMYGFAMLLQVTFCWSLGGLIFFQKYLKTRKAIWQIASCLMLFISLGTYEVAYVMCPLYLVLALHHERRFIPAVRSILPQLTVGIAWFAFWIYKTLHAAAPYAGVSVSLNDQVGWTFLKQLSGSTSFTNNILNLSMIESSLPELQFKRYWVIALSTFAVSACAFLPSKPRKMDSAINKKEEAADRRSDQALWWVSLCLVVLPTVLIAISAKYQKEVGWGKGYLPAYINCWGVSLGAAILFARYRESNVNRIIKTLVSAILCLMIIIPNQMIADLTVQRDDNWANWAYRSDQLFREAREAGMFDDFSDEDIILDQNTFLEPENHFSFLFDRRITAKALSSADPEGKETQEPSGARWLYAMDGPRVCVLFGKTERITAARSGEILAEGCSLMVYVPKGYERPQVTVNMISGGETTFRLDDKTLKTTTEKGNLYWLESSEIMDLSSARFN